MFELKALRSYTIRQGLDCSIDENSIGGTSSMAWASMEVIDVRVPAGFLGEAVLVVGSSALLAKGLVVPAQILMFDGPPSIRVRMLNVSDQQITIAEGEVVALAIPVGYIGTGGAE